MNSPLAIDVLTLFPGMLQGFVSESILGQARQTGLLSLQVHNLRDWATDKHQVTDDRPFGGGAGMVLKPEPLAAAIRDLRREHTLTIFLTPDGEGLSTPLAREFAQTEHLLLISGHYEGIDQRIRDHFIDREVSIGDYVLTNGTLPAAVLVDAVARQIPGVLGEPASLAQDSFADNRTLGAPQYTRPADFEGHRVPEVLLSGNHAAIDVWRQQQRAARTQQRRPDLLSSPLLTGSVT